MTTIVQTQFHIPIVVDHDAKQIIGYVYIENNNMLVAEFAEGIKVTEQMAKEVFHGFGMLVLRGRHGLRGQIFIEKVQLLEFSLTFIAPPNT